VGYDWAFATIFPLLFLTAEVSGPRFSKRKGRGPRLKLSKPVQIVLGACWARSAQSRRLVWPSVWLAPVIWLSFILLLESFECDARAGGRSRATCAW